MQPSTVPHVEAPLTKVPVVESHESSELTQEEIARAEALIESGPTYIEHFGEIGADVAGFVKKYVAEEATADRDEKWMASVAEYIHGVVVTISGSDMHGAESSVATPLVKDVQKLSIDTSRKTNEILESGLMGTIDLQRSSVAHPDIPMSIQRIQEAKIIPRTPLTTAPLLFIGALAKSFAPADHKKAA